MKKLSLVILSLMLLIACSKDSNLLPASSKDATGTTGSLQQSTRPFKGNLFTSIDPTSPPLGCSGDIPGFGIPTTLFLHGNVAHLGELIWDHSTLNHISCNVNVATMQLTVTISGQITASNGDHINYTGTDVIDITNLLVPGNGTTGSITGNWTITGGSGRFEDASGSFAINGTVEFSTLAVSFAADGTITY